MEYKLKESIIGLSESDNWEDAKYEWRFTYSYSVPLEMGFTCKCGKKPIMEVCVLYNTLNKREAKVGNVCVKKFLGIQEGTRIFNAVKKLKKDIRASMGLHALKYLYKRNAIGQSDFNSYKSNIRKRKLTDEEYFERERHNRKLLELQDLLSKINYALDWASSQENFDTSFLDGIRLYLLKTGSLTYKQANSLGNIIKKCNIKID